MNWPTQLATWFRPPLPAAVGPGHLVRGRALAARLLVLVTFAVLAGGALGLKAAGRGEREPLPPLPGVARVTPHVLRGGQPDDFQLRLLRDSYHVRAIVNLRHASGAESDIAASFGLDFLGLPLAVGEAPTTADLATLASFVRRYENGSAVVLVHDDVGGGRAVTTGLMLLMLRGESLDAVTGTLPAADKRHLSAGQWDALRALNQVLAGPGRATPGTRVGGR
ncbi:hypothetical protein GA0070624_2873 [Micromonospora rhizosphaerae]|uniref:Tyrosine phosphatase family protein n=1 Tax=Micromonospora rhizosphaerae TaxID=568872 RepID=A0A1C6S4H3_9ACTN|nr:hypothetical protein [Micromonospora rhizosphaerae]SCL24184.1 hypothetical protein GA0070624_2873 [Micromonospora rhizosphaerae]